LDEDIMSDILVAPRRAVPASIPPLLSFAAGFVDACTALALFGLFVAQVTGSFVLAAVAFVTQEQGAVIKVLAIPIFLLAAVLTTVLAVLVERRGRAALTWTLGLECLVLSGFLLALLIGAPLSGPNALPTVIASLLGIFAMGMQSAMVRLLMARVPSTNVMTTNTTELAIAATELLLAWHARRVGSGDAAGAAAYDAARARLARLAPIMIAFLLGTVAGTVAYATAGIWGLLLPLAIMYGVFGWAGTWSPRRAGLN
jgi:uncharacterized membrane protein YoaK (UPF0700 family)